MTETLLIQFAKSPKAGKVKTRMLSALTPEQAAELHIALVEHTAAVLVNADLGRTELAVAGDTSHPVFQRCLDRGITRLTTQRGVDLGERMFAALAEGLTACKRVLLIGSDCPSLDADYLRSAIAALEDNSVVLGAATDGGFVLVGVTRIEDGMFDAVEWGSDRVLAQTQMNLESLGLPCKTLRALQDVDRPEDLAHWEAVKADCR